MKNKLRRTILIISISLLFTTLCDIPYESFTVSTSTDQIVLPRWMPFNNLNLALMEHHFIKTLTWQSHVPNAHTFTPLHVLATKCKQRFIYIIECAAVSPTDSCLTTQRWTLARISQVPNHIPAVFCCGDH